MTENVSSRILDQLPEPERCDLFRLDPGDTLVHALGFEDRTMAVTDRLIADKLARAILLDYRPRNLNNRLADVRSALSDAGIQIGDDDLVVYDRFNPGGFEEMLGT